MNRKVVSFNEIWNMLISKGFDISMSSLLNILSKMPLERKKIERKSIILVNKKILKSYLPYSNRNVKDFKNYMRVIELYKKSKNISFISRKTEIPWSTIRDWVYERARPRILHGEWYKELQNRKI